MAFRGFSAQLSLSRFAAVLPGWGSKELGRGESWGAGALGFAWLNVMGSFPHWMHLALGLEAHVQTGSFGVSPNPGSRRRRK